MHNAQMSVSGYTSGSEKTISLRNNKKTAGGCTSYISVTWHDQAKVFNPKLFKG